MANVFGILKRAASRARAFVVITAFSYRWQTEAINLAPTHRIKQSIRRSVEKTETGYRATLSVSLQEAPEAAAFEYGSGIHSEKGGGGKYLIAPKEKQALAFQWEKANPKIPRLPDGRVVLPYVYHPGVVGKSYLRSSLASLKGVAFKDLAKAIAEDFAEDVRISIEEQFK